jgi:hypothetical protein
MSDILIVTELLEQKERLVWTFRDSEILGVCTTNLNNTDGYATVQALCITCCIMYCAHGKSHFEPNNPTGL